MSLRQGGGKGVYVRCGARVPLTATPIHTDVIRPTPPPLARKILGYERYIATLEEQ